ncbi:hypothetical protein AB4Z46_34670 [Variovorax sp. M-6]|uniref:hypothetical protein n=1 Tax=Variovorax sp. M-6 TaxID=3233041 RepID=UPI003F94475E
MQKISSFKAQALFRRLVATSGPERSSWEAVGALAKEARPNWGLDLHAEREPFTADAFVYLVDTSNLWIAAAAVAPAQLASLRDEVGGETGQGESTELRADSAAAMASASLKAQTGDGGMASLVTLRALAVGLRAIAAAPEFAAAAEQSPGPDNSHWLLLLYHLSDGEVIAGLGHVDDPIPGMLDRATLFEYVAIMVEMHLKAGTVLDAAVERGGGVVLAPALEAVGLA